MELLRTPRVMPSLKKVVSGMQDARYESVKSLEMSSRSNNLSAEYGGN